MRNIIIETCTKVIQYIWGKICYQLIQIKYVPSYYISIKLWKRFGI